MAKAVTKHEPLRAISSHFQRSINVTYDAGNSDYVGGFIPTNNSALALANILKNSQSDSRHRAHVLHAPYGSGKSLTSLVLSAVASHDLDCAEAIQAVFARIERHYPESAAVISNYWESGKRLLPVILSGDEGSLTVSLTRGLNRALGQRGLADLRPRTQFNAALETIDRWEKLYPAAFSRFQHLIEEQNYKFDELIEGLKTGEPSSLNLFSTLYEIVTAGANFDAYVGVSLADAYHETSKSLKTVGWDGILIIWDEFGRFMEAKAGEVFGNEAAQLQDFAEFCNRSGDTQVHIILVTHRQLSTYASDLPTIYQQEWARIAERFWPHEIISDPSVIYRLMAEALLTPNKALWNSFLDVHESIFRKQTTYALELELFPDVNDDITLRQNIIEQTWPLHPLTVYALPRLSSQVAQNERTLFTFLAADDQNSLQAHLTNHAVRDNNLPWWEVGIDAIWDYFANSIRMDTKPGGAHAIWSGVVHALGKVSSEDILGQRIVKAMGVLTAIGEVNTQKEWDFSGKIIPSTEVIAWSVGIHQDVAQTYLDKLAQRKVVSYRQSDGFWAFMRGSDVDLEQEIATLIAKSTPNSLQLRQILERSAPLPFHLPRGHNVQKSIVRYFHSLYRWSDEVKAPLGGDELLKRLGGSLGYADGVVVYVLPLSTVDIEAARNSIRDLPAGRALYVIPERPLLITEPLQELFALRELQNNPQFLERDRERLPRELEFYAEDAERRLKRALRPLLGYEGAEWLYGRSGEWQSLRVRQSGHTSRLLSNLCDNWFALTPRFNNESLNVHKPSDQQINASEKVIDHLLKRVEAERFPFDLDLTGYGPDRLVLRTVLVQTNLFSPTEETKNFDEAEQQWQLSRPDDRALGHIWDLVNEFLDSATEEEQEITNLIETLQLPPFGLRRGVLPVLLATIMRPRMQVITLRQQRQAVSPLTGEAFTALCQRPEEFTIEVGIWDDRRAVLWQVLENRIYPFLASQEHALQPLSYLSIGLLRWLQSLPRYCRDTQQLSDDALTFRRLIRDAQREPARVLLYDLLDLLDSIEVEWGDVQAAQQALHMRLSQLMDEISDAYQALRYELDRFAEQAFGSTTGKRLYEGQAILLQWLQDIDKQVDGGLNSFRFSDTLVQRFVNALKENEDNSRFWERMSHAILGVSTSDWNDRSLQSFKQALQDARERLHRELFSIAEEDDTVELRISQTGEEENTYRFRPSELSKQGQFILENFKSTMAIAGRPLSPDEKRQLALAFLHYILDGDTPENERKNRSLRGRI
ncbi:MAG: hypothetical protein IT327_06380 [Anaerolineae bacterium]|nr:hypothetical protein [Anaerolineae bacterium]